MSPQRVRTEPSALTPASRKSLGEDVADRLREAILHGELSPGERLREEDLAERLHVSRAPVRAAFVLLERCGRITEREAARVDVEFHDTVYRAAHHQRSAWEQIRLPAYWFMLSRNVASPDWRNATLSGHAEIMRIIKAGPHSPAARAVTEHITFAHERILQSCLNWASPAATAVEPAGGEGS